MMKIKDKYVVWDGENEKAYHDDSKWHDCVITVDGKFLSVQKLRRKLLESNVLPTVVFACKSNQSATETEINGKVKGVFSHYWTTLLEQNQELTFRDAIKLVNMTMRNSGFHQQAEVMCRIDILDLPVINTSISDRGHVVMIMDMCRTKISKGKKEFPED